MIKYIYIVLAAGLLMTACSKQIQQKQTDPNDPTSVPPNLILGTVLQDMSGNGKAGALGPGGQNSINSWDDTHRWNQYHCSNYDYYDNNIYNWTNGNFDSYLVMKNVIQMEKEATSRGAAPTNAFEALGRFIRAYYFYNLTMLYGDVPLTQALQAPGVSAPAYSPQEQVFKYVLDQLDTANSHMASLIANSDNELSPTQDMYFGGSLKSWQKVVNSFKLRVLVNLSNKASDATLNIPAQFAAIVGNSATYPIFTGVSDDMEFRYNPGGTNSYSLYPLNPSNFGSIAQRENMAATYVSALTANNDPRVFVTSEPAWALVGNDPNPAQFKYFVGASTGEPLATMYGNATANLYSFANRLRYYSNFTGEPDVLVGYKEMCFNIAEGIARGWASGNAEAWYKNGIMASMAFYGIDVSKTSFTAYFLPPDKNSVTQVVGYPFTFDFNAWYATPSIKLSSTLATAVSQIALQKYIVCFENSGYEGYYTWRRTGTPVFQGGSGVGNNGLVPLRWAYPVSEQAQNKTNYTASLSTQQFSSDDLNQKMWVLK
jgi:hypothetical protein